MLNSKKNQIYDKHVKQLLIVSSAIKKYSIKHALARIENNKPILNIQQIRSLSNAMLKDRNQTFNHNNENNLSAGDLYATVLIHEIFHELIAVYVKHYNHKFFQDALLSIKREIGDDEFDDAMLFFITHFTPQQIYEGNITPKAYIKSNQELILEEMLLVWTTNLNPAIHKFKELFDDSILKKNTAYSKTLKNLLNFSSKAPLFKAFNLSIEKMIRQPAIKEPESIKKQLIWIKQNYGEFLANLQDLLLTGLDIIKEEQKQRFAGAGPTQVPDYDGYETEDENYTVDRDWMPKVVLLAKSVFVWLSQLSKKYGFTINRLDLIPDEELDIIKKRGFTGLWLIGLWERSRASKLIKQLTGNPEATGSAYSLIGYNIAWELGGWEALHNLKQRCMKRGIRLASDMVPNHTGIDSHWIKEHPERFIQVEQPPFPSYSFSGKNLSSDPHTGIWIEDGYYSRTDAAVVFKRSDFNTGETTYIYHGNDGTSMPWNDTAQLDYLKKETREAVIETIIHVAKNFSIIRFDAAMTLAKKHFYRLWYPEHGSGGDIPSRAEHGMKRKQFNKLFPVEFWREVVDRIATEVPDTLLLAEAFWLMEGYFVRTLGMHRVYNSAFMNMLKNEENRNYRNAIKNTLVFDREILKRYVNFMNNPDEETAIRQFGRDDKYFGVCTLLCTLPGLPMFGHGQIEGFEEKYGMEYTRPMLDEQPDSQLVKRHEKEIFPLLKKRYLFAEVKNFLFYACTYENNQVNENVFAYSNSYHDERALIVYNNCYQHASGRIKISEPYTVKSNDGSAVQVTNSLAKGLGCDNENHAFLIFQEFHSKLFYLRSCKEIKEQGMFIDLQGYEYQVYLNFGLLHDDENMLITRLYQKMNGKGMNDPDREIKLLRLENYHGDFVSLFNESVFQLLKTIFNNGGKTKLPNEFAKKLDEFINETIKLSGMPEQSKKLTDSVLSFFEQVRIAGGGSGVLKKLSTISNEIALYFKTGADKEKDKEIILTLFFVFDCLTGLSKQLHKIKEINCKLIRQLELVVAFEFIFNQENNKNNSLLLITLFDIFSNLKISPELFILKAEKFNTLLEIPEAGQFLSLHKHKENRYIAKEPFERLVWWIFTIDIFKKIRNKISDEELLHTVHHTFAQIKNVLRLAKEVEYNVDLLVDRLSD